jgi:hypothetical protein
MADQAPDEVLDEIADSYGATIEIEEDELTGEATVSLVTDSESVTASGFSRTDAIEKAILAAEEVGWERPIS